MGVKREDDFEISRDIAHRDKADVIFFAARTFYIYMYQYIIKNVFFFNIEKTLNMLFCICRTMLIYLFSVTNRVNPIWDL